jgi:hypothetical protein
MICIRRLAGIHVERSIIPAELRILPHCVNACQQPACSRSIYLTYLWIEFL